MLLIDNHQAELSKHRMLLDQRMRSDHYLNLSGRDLFQEGLLFRLLDSSADDAYSITQRSENAFGIDVMLLREDFGRRHKRRLKSVFNGNHDRLERNDGFAAADITLHQANHRIRRFQVIHDFFEDAFLGRRRMKRQNRLYSLPDSIRSLESNAGQRASLRSAQSVNELEQKE